MHCCSTVYKQTAEEALKIEGKYAILENSELMGRAPAEHVPPIYKPQRF
jgi:hypothetical protein